jgi:hypothetical protein
LDFVQITFIGKGGSRWIEWWYKHHDLQRIDGRRRVGMLKTRNVRQLHTGATKIIILRDEDRAQWDASIGTKKKGIDAEMGEIWMPAHQGEKCP